MDFIHAIILGIVEGITEFLPISSTGHMILVGKLLGLQQTEFVKSFEIIIQLGAILAVVLMYWRRFLELETLKKLLTAFIPTAVLGLVFYGIVKTYLLESATLVLWSLLIGGIILILFEKFMPHPSTDESQELTYKQSFLVGLFQAIAMIPGVSRSAATIIGGLTLGISRAKIVEFSFLLAVPTMLSATVLDLSKSYSAFNAGDLPVLAMGFVVAFLVAWASIKYFLQYVRKHDFVLFGIYRIILAIIFFIFLV